MAPSEEGRPSSHSMTSSDEGKVPRASLRAQLHKTKFCAYFLKGACQYGLSCAFAHAGSELRAMPDMRKTRLCKNFMEGSCTDAECNFAHGKDHLVSADPFHKKSMCKWHTKGKCRSGAHCTFAHGLAQLPGRQPGAHGPAAPGGKGCGAGPEGAQGPTRPPACGAVESHADPNPPRCLAEPMKVSLDPSRWQPFQWPPLRLSAVAWSTPPRGRPVSSCSPLVPEGCSVLCTRVLRMACTRLRTAQNLQLAGHSLLLDGCMEPFVCSII